MHERPLRVPRCVWPRPAALAWPCGGLRLRVTGSAISGDSRHVSGDIGGHGDTTVGSTVVARPTEGRIAPFTFSGRANDGTNRSSSIKGRIDRYVSSMPANVCKEGSYVLGRRRSDPGPNRIRAAIVGGVARRLEISLPRRRPHPHAPTISVVARGHYW